MAETHAFAEDLQFVRRAVESRDRPRPTLAAPLIVWTLYCLVCIPVYDFWPKYGGRTNFIGWTIAALFTALFSARAGKRSGEFDRQLIYRICLHWYGGIALMMLTIFGLAWTHQLRSAELAGQLSIIFVGFLYFTAGVHFSEMRFMIWAGPIIVLTGVGVGLLPHYRWSVAGLVFAACLMAPVIKSLLKQREPTQSK